VILADARHLPIADGVVQCCVTSPPYFGLRDYKVQPSVWGGDPVCPHIWVLERVDTEVGRGNWSQGVNGRGEEQPGGVDAKREPIRAVAERGYCELCGAWRGSLGLEPTPVLYIEHLVTVFREVRRALRDDGTTWVNLGDSYAGSWGAQSREHAGKHAPNISALSANQVKAAAIRASGTGALSRTPGCKAKDLIGIPWMAAFALRSDGWYLRSDVIWSKPNPMPESVTDRPTKAHEYVFLLAKSERYFYDDAAIREPYAETTLREAAAGYDGLPLKDYAAAGVQNPSDTKRRIVESVRRRKGQQPRASGPLHSIAKNGGRHQHVYDPAGRNARSVWTIPTQPYPQSHFATMPEALAERCILAGSRPGDWVLDPFLGSGTTARVAISLGRRAIGCDLQGDYLPLQRERMQVTRGLPLEMEGDVA